MSDAALDPPAVPPSGAAALSRRILAFAGVPFLALLAPFIFLPVLSRLAGVDAWVAIALGQSVGGLAALIAGVGYATLAPPVVARADGDERRRILATSIHIRLPVWAVASVVAAAVAGMLAPHTARVEAVLMAIAMSLAALAPTWYWIGVGRVRPVILLEVLPRMAAAVLATGILLLGGPVTWYPLLLIAAMLVAPLWVYPRYAAGSLGRVDRGEMSAVWRRHPPALVAETAAGIYNVLAVGLVTAVAPVSEAARFVSGDKAYRIGQYAVSALGNALQGWVVEAGEARFPARFRVVVVFHGGLGIVGMLAFGALGPWATSVLFGAHVAIDSATAWGFGVALLGVALGTAFGRLGLISLDARTVFMVCVVVAAGIGATSLLIGGSRWGAAGAAWGLGATELASGLAQGIALAAVWRRRKAAGRLLPGRSVTSPTTS
jgi:hypothetical protein